MSAWEKGLKTTYYLHMKPRHTAEQSTTTVNKSATIGKVGFGALKRVSPSIVMDTPSPIPTPEPVATISEQLAAKAEAKIEKEIVEEVTSTIKAEVIAEINLEPKVEIKSEVPHNVPSPVKVEKIRPRVTVVGNKTCPTDPAELAQCDSCQ